MKSYIPLITVLFMCGGCSNSSPEATNCPGGSGPALNSDSTYVLVAHTFDETWRAVTMTDTPRVLPQIGLTGRASNDLDVVGTRMYVVNSLSNSVQEINLFTGETLDCVDLGVDVSPWELLVDPTDPTRAYVTGWLSGEILEVDLAAGIVRQRVMVEPGVQGLAVSGENLLVTAIAFESEGDYGQGHVVVLQKTTLETVRRIPVPTNPQSFVTGPDGLVHVICTGNYNDISGRVVRLNRDLTAVSGTLELGGSPNRGALTPNNTVYVTGFNGLMTYDAQSFTAIRDAANPLLPNPDSQGGYTGVALAGPWIVAAHLGSVATPGFLVWINHTSGTLQTETIVGNGPVALAVWGP